MKTVVFAVTIRGAEAAEKIMDLLKKNSISENPDIKVYIKQKCDTLAQSRCVTFFDGDEMAGYVQSEFARSDALIFVCAAGIAVRMIAPCLKHKSKDPAVLVIDEGMNYCIPILSGHLGGANELARTISAGLGTVPVITTASDIAGLTAADMFAKSLGLVITDFEKAKILTKALLDGEKIGVVNEAPDVVSLEEGDLPDGYMMSDGRYHSEKSGDNSSSDKYTAGLSAVNRPQTDEAGYAKRIRITYKKSEDEDVTGDQKNTVILDLVPRCLTVGIGCRRGTGREKIGAAIDRCFGLHNLNKSAIERIASIDLKSDEEGLLDHCNDEGLPCTFYSADRLNKVEGDFTGSDFVSEVTGVDNVCERSAVAEGGRLIVKKEAYDGVTLAVAVRSDVVPKEPSPWHRSGVVPKEPSPWHRLYVVGIGPGDEKGMTIRAREVLDKCRIIAGYKTYIDLVKPLLSDDKEYIETGMRAEEERCRMALEAAASGRGDVCMICSGDAGIYGMAGLIYELAGEYPGVKIEVIPGVTAALSGSALLGAAAGHDLAIISLSDLLTPWDLIEKRLKAAAEGDYVIALYNPASRKRADYLKKACDIVGKVRSGDTVCGYVRNIGRAGEEVVVTSLKELGVAKADMFTTVFIGNSMTENIDGHMVTPRGYKL